MESTPYVLSFRMMFFNLVGTGWIFDMLIYVRIQSIKKAVGRADKNNDTVVKQLHNISILCSGTVSSSSAFII